MKHNYTGASLKELKEKYGIGSSGFYLQNWYKNEKFFIEKPKAGVYEIELGEDLVNLTYNEQLKKLKKGYKPIHPAILAETILSHYARTKKRLLERIWVRTSNVVSDGDRVCVGDFDSRGLDVGSVSDGARGDYLGLSSARKLEIEPRSFGTFEELGLVERVLRLEQTVEKLTEIINK